MRVDKEFVLREIAGDYIIIPTGKTISSIYCQICGKPIEFGTLCPECHRLQGLKIVAQQYAEQKSEMRFINKGKKF